MLTYHEHIQRNVLHAKKAFEDFHAEYELNNDDISVIRWCNKNGTIAYNMTIIFDKKRGHMYIDGDLGTAVFHFRENTDIETVTSYSCSISYFMEKMVCTTDNYVYDSDIAEQELKDHLLDENTSDDEKENILSLIQEIIEDYDQYGDGVCLHEDYYNRIMQIHPDCFEWVYSIGRLPHQRIIIWMIALQMIKSELTQTKYSHEIY